MSIVKLLLPFISQFVCQRKKNIIGRAYSSLPICIIIQGVVMGHFFTNLGHCWQVIDNLGTLPHQLQVELGLCTVKVFF